MEFCYGYLLNFCRKKIIDLHGGQISYLSQRLRHLTLAQQFLFERILAPFNEKILRHSINAPLLGPMTNILNCEKVNRNKFG